MCTVNIYVARHKYSFKLNYRPLFRITNYAPLVRGRGKVFLQEAEMEVGQRIHQELPDIGEQSEGRVPVSRSTHWGCGHLHPHYPGLCDTLVHKVSDLFFPLLSHSGESDDLRVCVCVCIRKQ